MMTASNRRANASNAPANAYYRILQFLETRPSGDEYWCPKLISIELEMPQGTTRYVLKKLKEQGKVIYTPKGKIHLYASARRFSDDYNRLFKVHGAKERYEIHGLTLKIEAKTLGLENFANVIPQGGVLRDKFAYFGGETSFQISHETFMVWGGFSERPLDYDRFLLWLSAVDGFCRAKGWPVFQGNFGRWFIVQYGFNRDWMRFRNDSPTRCVSLQGFEKWFARVYDKKELGVLREEIHSHEEKSLEEFVMLASGGLTSAQVMNYLAMVVQSLNTSHAVNVDIVKRVGQLADQLSSLTKEISKLKEKL